MVQKVEVLDHLSGVGRFLVSLVGQSRVERGGHARFKRSLRSGQHCNGLTCAAKTVMVLVHLLQVHLVLSVKELTI